jgi:MerR family copper efflux transcriptional regulator
MNKHLTIGQVAQEVGIPPKTIRYYEEIDLIQPAKRLDNKYRAYTKEDIARLRLIKQARILGLSLDEVKHLVEECIEGSCEHLKNRFLTKLPQYITAVKERIDELQALQAQLESLQDNLKTLPLSNPQQRVGEKGCCEVLEQMEAITQKGDVRNGTKQTQS